jgi:hypothetical protein
MKHNYLIALKQINLLITDGFDWFTDISSKILCTSKNKTVNNLFWSLIISNSAMSAFVILLLSYISGYLGHALHGIIIRH